MQKTISTLTEKNLISHFAQDPHAVSNLNCEQGPMREKSIRCRWTWAIRPENETIFLFDGMYMMERECRGEEIVVEGDQLVDGRVYTIRIRDAEVKIALKSMCC